ncbi:MAG: DNA adenine methylase [Rhodocyclaceae bacterium]|nr:DNA adenine methylase [Rhodocyclaceae bacterium]
MQKDPVVANFSSVGNEKKWTPLKAPFGYYGGKQRVASKIVGTLPVHNAWVEAFCGSAALTCAKQPAAIEVINDINGEVVNFFRHLRDNSAELCRVIKLTPYSRGGVQCG